MDHLSQQTAAKEIEIVFVVAATASFNPDEADLRHFHGWKTVTVEKVGSIGQGFAAGIGAASAPIVALTEDHSYPDRRWAELFIARHREPWAVVGPAMSNANPGSALSWADFYQAYGPWASPAASGRQRHLPGHNSCYKRDILLSLGASLPILMQAESVLHRVLRAQGYQLLLETGTCTSHQNFDTWVDWLPARYFAGRQFAGTWSASWPRAKRLLYMLGSPGIPWLRLWHTGKYVSKEHARSFRVKLMLMMLAGFTVQAAGNLMGFAVGTGDAGEKIARYEFHRTRRDEKK